MLPTPTTVTKVAAPPPTSSQHVFDFNAWDGRWTGSILRLPIRFILEGLNLATQVIPGNGHCLFSSLLVGLQVPVTITAVQQLRELISCHVEQNFDRFLGASMPEVTKLQLLEQLRCFDDVAHSKYWGDANCVLAFTSCFGVGVVVLSAQDDTFHWAFAAESKMTITVSFDEERSHYEAVVSTFVMQATIPTTCKPVGCL